MIPPKKEKTSRDPNKQPSTSTGELKREPGLKKPETAGSLRPQQDKRMDPFKLPKDPDPEPR